MTVVWWVLGIVGGLSLALIGLTVLLRAEFEPSFCEACGLHAKVRRLPIGTLRCVDLCQACATRIMAMAPPTAPAPTEPHDPS
jgi:hypothetical protein